jgi:hypothetical protein
MQVAEILSRSLCRALGYAWQVHFRAVDDEGQSRAFSVIFEDKIPWKFAGDIAQVKVAGIAELVGLPCPPQIRESAFCA